MVALSSIPYHDPHGRDQRTGLPAAPAAAAARSLHDVARLAGVAPITASRALNTPEQVSPEVRQKVADAIARTGYVPNRLAGGLASARSRLVAAIVPTITGPIFLQTVQALTESLGRHGYQLMLGRSGYHADREDDAARGDHRPAAGRHRLTGILHAAQGRKRLLSAGIPVVETWDFTTTPIDMLVGFRTRRSAARWRAVPAREGAARLALIAGDDERARRRGDAFAAAARALGLGEPRSIVVPAPTTFAAAQRVRRAVARAVGGGYRRGVLQLGPARARCPRGGASPVSRSPVNWR